jgi:hypothetical protein
MVNGFGNASMDFTGKFKKRRPDAEDFIVRNGANQQFQAGKVGFL